MINRMMLQGRLVKDIELVNAGGFNKAEFTIAWSEKYKETEKQCFLRCVAWRSTAEFLSKYFKKGQEIAIEGQMITDSWEKDGQKQSRTLCNIEKVHFCGSKGSNTENNPPSAPSSNDFMTIPDGDAEELPFV
jgi:single-strand DNA-binding protein